MPLVVKTIKKTKVGFFRFKKLIDHYLLTNDTGEHCFLTPERFNLFLEGKVEKNDVDAFAELQSKGFIRNMLDFDSLSKKYTSKNDFLFYGPSLHIIVITLRCNHRCLYCQSSAQKLNAKQFDMDTLTAKKTIDKIFESPNPNINIEFQGGEPLINFDIVKLIIEYANEKNKTLNKKITFSLVSNLSFLDEKKLAFLISSKVSVCTSLDGPKFLHSKNRISVKKNSYENTIKWIKKISKEIKKNKKYKYKINALATITKDSLPYPKKIIDTYVKLGFQSIHLRPLQPFGINKKNLKRIDFSAEDFINFYKKALEYILELNLKGIKIFERTATIFLTKILTNKDPNFLDMRSPCGAGTGQIAYNFNGNVYACDEARMLSMQNDQLFRMGNVHSNTYDELIKNDVVEGLCTASCLDNIPACNECVYKPYCGVCPIYNYATEGHIFSKLPKNNRCKINTAILDFLFLKLKEKNPKIMDILLNWVLFSSLKEK